MRIIRKNDLHIARSGERFALGTMQLCWCTTVIQIVKILERRLRTKEHVEKVSLTDSGMIERSKRTRPIEAVLLNRSCWVGWTLNVGSVQTQQSQRFNSGHVTTAWPWHCQVQGSDMTLSISSANIRGITRNNILDNTWHLQKYNSTCGRTTKWQIGGWRKAQGPRYRCMSPKNSQPTQQRYLEARLWGPCGK